MFPPISKFFRRLPFGALGLLIIISAACTATPNDPSPTPTLTLSPTAVLPPAVPDAIAPTPTLAAPLAEPITLTLWLPTEFSAEPARQILDQQLADFAANADGVPAQVLIKNDLGPGGLFDLLKAASPVAPRVLPDLIALDASELEPAARSGLLQPIGPLLPADLVADFFPFARDLGTINQTLYGLVYRADVEHLAFNPRVVDSAPARWNDIVSGTQIYVFALYDASGYVSDAVLAHYLALGGSWQPTLDQAALTTLLQNLQQAKAAGVLPANLATLDDAVKVWSVFQATNAGYANVPASFYLDLSTRATTAQFAPLPALDRPTAPIGHGWVLALVAREPRRQAAALRLLQWLIAPENNGALTHAERVLPGRSAALSTWDQSDPYTGFIREQLLIAHAAPPAAVLNTIGPLLRQAIEDVLAGRATPVEAAQAAVAALGTPKP